MVFPALGADYCPQDFLQRRLTRLRTPSPVLGCRLVLSDLGVLGLGFGPPRIHLGVIPSLRMGVRAPVPEETLGELR